MKRPGMKRALAVIVAALACACSRDDDASPLGVGARVSVFVPTQDVTLAKQLSSGMTSSERLVVRADVDWLPVWARIHGTQQPAPNVVRPDFGSEMALVAALGEKPSGGFDIVIDSVTRHERGAIVYVTETSPGPNCMTTGALTQPVHAVRAPRTDGLIQWHERSITNSC
jgi:hypothetical protein